MEIDEKLLAKIKKDCERKMNMFVLKGLFEKGFTEVGIRELNLAGFNVEFIVNLVGNQNPESILNELPFFATYHYEGFSLKKDEFSSLYDPQYTIEKNSLLSLRAKLENLKMINNYVKNIRENTEWARQFD